MNRKGRAHCRIAGEHDIIVQAVMLGMVCGRSDEFWVVGRSCARCGFVRSVGSIRRDHLGWYLPNGITLSTRGSDPIMVNYIDVKTEFKRKYGEFSELIESDIYVSSRDIAVYMMNNDIVVKNDLRLLWFELREFHEGSDDLDLLVELYDDVQ